MKNREAQDPGRVLITPEDGSAPFYAVMTRADNPIEEGDPLNKNTLLKDTTAALYGLDAAALPDDVLKLLSRFHGSLGDEYLWERRGYTPPSYTQEAINGAYTVNVEYYMEVELADSIEAKDNGEIWLVNPTTQTVSGLDGAKTYFPGKYFKVNSGFYNSVTLKTGVVYFCPAGATFETKYYGGVNYAYTAVLYSLSGIAAVFGDISYVNSPDPDAYPTGVSGGYTYEALGMLGANAKTATGSYVGTGTYGSANPCSLTFDFVPELIWIYYIKSGSTPGQSTEGGIYPGNYIVRPENLATSYQSSAGFWGKGSSTTVGGNSYGKKSADNKTISWYHAQSAGDQLNASGAIYYYIAIG